MGDSFPQHTALREDSELGTVTLILEGDCILTFMGLLLLVEGLKVFATLSFDSTESSRRGWMVLRQTVVGPRGRIRRISRK